MTDAYYTTELKVKPQLSAASPPLVLPKGYSFSDKDASRRMQTINTDIYQGAKKEKTSNEFNKKLYFKIFGGVVLFTAGIACIRKFFRKS